MSEVAELVRAGMHPAEATSIDRDDAIKLIREALKKRSGKTWSVTGGRGTGWGWIHIMSPPKRRVSSDGTRNEVDAESNYYMSEADCVELGKLLALHGAAGRQGESIPASSDYRRVYITKALGLELASHAEPYWD